MFSKIWDNLGRGNQVVLTMVSAVVFIILFIVTWIYVLASSPNVVYECNKEQSVFVQKSIKDCVSNRGYMSNCVEQSQIAYCSVVKGNNDR